MSEFGICSNPNNPLRTGFRATQNQRGKSKSDGGLCSPAGMCLLQLPLTRNHRRHAGTHSRREKVLRGVPTPSAAYVSVNLLWCVKGTANRTVLAFSGRCRWAYWRFHRLLHLPWCPGPSPGVSSKLLMLDWNQPEGC